MHTINDKLLTINKGDIFGFSGIASIIRRYSYSAKGNGYGSVAFME